MFQDMDQHNVHYGTLNDQHIPYDPSTRHDDKTLMDFHCNRCCTSTPHGLRLHGNWHLLRMDSGNIHHLHSHREICSHNVHSTSTRGFSRISNPSISCKNLVWSKRLNCLCAFCNVFIIFCPDESAWSFTACCILNHSFRLNVFMPVGT